MAELRSAGFGLTVRRQLIREAKNNTEPTLRFKKQKRHMAKNEDGDWKRRKGDRKAETKPRREKTRRTRNEWKLFGECSLHLGFSFVYSSGPRSSPSLRVLAGDYILGSGQRDVGGRGGIRAIPESGITFCRSTTPTLSHFQKQERNRTHIKRGDKVFHHLRRKCSMPPCLRN